MQLQSATNQNQAFSRLSNQRSLISQVNTFDHIIAKNKCPKNGYIIRKCNRERSHVFNSAIPMQFFFLPVANQQQLLLVRKVNVYVSALVRSYEVPRRRTLPRVWIIMGGWWKRVIVSSSLAGAFALSSATRFESFGVLPRVRLLLSAPTLIA